MRVLHCPTDTGGNAWGLSRAERKLGIQSDVMVRRADARQYPHDIDLRLRSGWWPSRFYRLTKFLVRAALDYDVFHFNWGMTIFDHWLWNVNCLELPLLKRLGKRIVVTFQGCDARMKTWSRDHLATSACQECDVAWCTERVDQIRQKRIKKIFVYADQVFALNPDLLHFLPGAEFLPYASVDASEWMPSRRSVDWKGQTQPLRILHLPTNRSIKGTRYVEGACERLRREGIAIELNVVENAPHAHMKELIEAADVVVDQLLVGWYGAVAVEAMALEKPVFCYLREEDLKRFVPFHEQIPIIRTTKETLADDLRDFLLGRVEGHDIGAAGRAFVCRYHDPLQIARRTILAYEKKTPRG
jgi:glycosyltransferase involved in cell wall biosynthesis